MVQPRFSKASIKKQTMDSMGIHMVSIVIYTPDTVPTAFKCL